MRGRPSTEATRFSFMLFGFGVVSIDLIDMCYVCNATQLQNNIDFIIAAGFGKLA